MEPSDVARQIAGTYIEDDRTPKPPLLEWIQSECRHGCFKHVLEEQLEKQSEPLRLDLAIVEKVCADKITVKVPCRLGDHESPSTFGVDISFDLNPLTLQVERI